MIQPLAIFVLCPIFHILIRSNIVSVVLGADVRRMMWRAGDLEDVSFLVHSRVSLFLVCFYK